jgi:tetratricopeptide (TPR) repeat protein
MSLDTQLKIRENSLSVQEYIKDLNSWLKQPTSVPKPVRDITPCTVRDLKEKANLKVISKEWPAAANLYTEAIEICKNNSGQAPLLSTLLVNRSLCYLKTGKHSKCCKDCNESLSLKKDNPKAFFRRALSLMGMSRWNEARADLDDCLEMVRSDTQMTQAVIHELSRLETLMVDETERINLDARRRVHTIVPPWVRAEQEDEEENLRILQIVGTATELTVPPILPVVHLDPVKEKYIPRAIRMRNKPGSCYLLKDLYTVECISHAGKINNACWENCCHPFIY